MKECWVGKSGHDVKESEFAMKESELVCLPTKRLPCGSIHGKLWPIESCKHMRTIGPRRNLK